MTEHALPFSGLLLLALTAPSWLLVSALRAQGVAPQPSSLVSPQAVVPQTPVTPAPPTSAPASSVEPIVSMRDLPTAAGSSLPAASGHQKSYKLTIAAGAWVDTGVTLTAGESVSFQTTGTVALNDGHSTDSDGLDRGWKDLLRQFPLNQARTGALIGRVSDNAASVPFSIGSSSTVVAPTSGHLFLRTNLTDDLNGTGTFTVRITFPQAATPRAVSLSPAKSISTDLQPSLFESIPRRVGDEAGNPGDMVNYALIGTEAQVLAAFKAAGWVAVDKNVGDAVLHGLLATLSHEAYTEVPMSTLFLFDRPQDLSFARGDPFKVAAERHHLRVWKSPETVHGLPLWVGSATHDIGFERDQRNGKATHKIDPEIDLERQFLLSSFDAAGVFQSAAYVTPANPLRDAHTATGGEFHSDGRIVVMLLQ